MKPLPSWTMVVAGTLASTSAWAYAAAPDADYAQPTAYLVYPANGAIDVPPDTKVFVADVTAVELEGPDGERLPALLDPSAPSFTGGVFVPFDELSVGAWTVKAVPATYTSNFAGEGVALDLGVFTVGTARDVDAPFVDALTAQWAIGPSGDDLTITVTLGGQSPSEPVRYEIDLGDRDTLMDGAPEAGSAWTPGASFTIAIGDTAPQIEPRSATVRVRATDSVGNVGEWSAPIAFSVFQTGRAPGTCAAAPGSVGGGAKGFVVVGGVVALGMAGRRRRRGRGEGRDHPRGARAERSERGTSVPRGGGSRA